MNQFTTEELEIIELALNDRIESLESYDAGANQMLTNDINEAKILIDKVRSL